MYNDENEADLLLKFGKENNYDKSKNLWNS